MAVPAASLQRGLTWLNRSADKMSPNAQAYAWYVLAKAGLADAGRVRYFQDANGGEIMRRPRLDAARRRAQPGRRARPRAARLRHRPPAHRSARPPATTTARRCATAPRCWRWRRRPAAARASPQVASAVRERLVAKVEYTTTQEQAWLVLAAHAHGRRRRARLLGRRRGAARRRKEPVVINPDAAAHRSAACAQATRANGRSGCRSPRAACRKDPQPAAEAGPQRRARPTTRSTASRPISRNVRQNDRLVVSISGLQRRRRLPSGGAARPAAGRLRDRIGGERGDGQELPVPARDHPTPASPRHATTASSPPSTSAAGPTARGGRATRSASGVNSLPRRLHRARRDAGQLRPAGGATSPTCTRRASIGRTRDGPRRRSRRGT